MIDDLGGVGIEAEKEEGKNLRHSAQVGILLTYSSLKVLGQPGNPALIPLGNKEACGGYYCR